MEAYPPFNPEKMDYGTGRQLREHGMNVEYFKDKKRGRDEKKREN